MISWKRKKVCEDHRLPVLQSKLHVIKNETKLYFRKLFAFDIYCVF